MKKYTILAVVILISVSVISYKQITEYVNSKNKYTISKILSTKPTGKEIKLTCGCSPNPTEKVTIAIATNCYSQTKIITNTGFCSVLVGDKIK